MVESRRGREIAPVSPNLIESMSSKARFQYLAATSAKYILQDYLAQYTDNRAPKDLKIALDLLMKAKTLDDLVNMEISPYKIVRDAVQDEIRVMQGLAPDSETAKRRIMPEIEVGSDGGNNRQMFGSATQKQTELAPVNERFDVRAHGLTHKPGSVSGSYQRFDHNLNQRVQTDLPLRQAWPD